MIPERNPKGRVAGKGGRGPKFKEAFTIRFWQPYHSITCYRSSGRSRMFKLRLGLGFQTYARIPLLGALWARVGLDSCVSSSSYSYSSACSSSSLCLRLHPPRYALSLTLATTSRGLCRSLYLLCASPLECPCHKTETGSKLTAP